MLSLVRISLTLSVRLSIALEFWLPSFLVSVVVGFLVCGWAAPGAGGSLAIAAATAARASRLASSMDFVATCVGRGSADLACVCGLGMFA